MKKLFIIISLVFAGVSLSAQSVDDVTLVVSGDGATKEDATHVALRSAIEQAYGVFVSANTEILNDELVKDEIATVTSGNVKSYKELSATILPNGNHMVSLQAVVSTKKLAAYAESKGASCEFAGATFGANLKLHELNRKNTELAFDNLRKQIKAFAPYIFSVKLEVGDPVLGNNQDATLPYTISLYSTPQMYELSDLIVTTLSALKLSPEQEELANRMNLPRFYISFLTRYVFNVDNTKRNSVGDLIETKSWKADDAWNQPFKREVEWDHSRYHVTNYFYAPFPYKGVREDIFTSLPSYCLVDNFGTQYNSFRYRPSYSDYKTITLSDRIKSEIIYIANCNWETSLDKGAKRSPFGNNNACFVFYDKPTSTDSDDHLKNGEINLPYSYIAPKVTKKEISFTPKYIGQVKNSITIPINTLTKITNFELKQIE